MELATNTVERAMRTVALGRKNALFAGADSGGRHSAMIATLIETAKLNNVDPFAWVAVTQRRSGSFTGADRARQRSRIGAGGRVAQGRGARVVRRSRRFHERARSRRSVIMALAFGAAPCVGVAKGIGRRGDR